MGIILLKDFLSLRERQKKELAFYQGRMEALTRKLDYIRRDIAVTEKILHMLSMECRDSLSILPSEPNGPDNDPQA